MTTAGGIDGHVDGSGGKAWSLGQKQLMCLGRAALRKVPILCLVSGPVHTGGRGTLGPGGGSGMHSRTLGPGG